jgi:acetyltransferase-like isoleucine patch superfamily enzyme
VIRSLYSTWVSVTYPFESAGVGLQIHPVSSLPRSHAHRVRLGRSVVVEKHGALHVRAPLEDVSREPVIVIGDNCTIGARSTISAKNCIKLDSNVTLGRTVLIQDHAHAYEDVTVSIKHQGITPGGRIRIGEGCHIGDGAVILCYKGELLVGPNCIVQPKSVITRSFPANSVLGGNPARVIRQADQSKEALT